MIQVAPRQHPQADNVRIRDSIQVIAKFLYFINLAITILYSTILVIVQHRIKYNSMSFVLIIIYGFLAIWVFIFDLLFVLIKKQYFAIWCNRFIVKIVIMIFPILCLIAYTNDHFFSLRSVTVFMIYKCIIALLMIIYQLYACSFGHHQEPQFLYRPNDLNDHYDEVWEKRNQFNRIKRLKGR